MKTSRELLFLRLLNERADLREQRETLKIEKGKAHLRSGKRIGCMLLDSLGIQNECVPNLSIFTPPEEDNIPDVLDVGVLTVGRDSISRLTGEIRRLRMDCETYRNAITELKQDDFVSELRRLLEDDRRHDKEKPP